MFAPCSNVCVLFYLRNVYIVDPYKSFTLECKFNGEHHTHTYVKHIYVFFYIETTTHFLAYKNVVVVHYAHLGVVALRLLLRLLFSCN